MFRIPFVLMLIFLMSMSTFSCEVCGCGTSVVNSGLLVNNNMRAFSIRYAAATFDHPKTDKNKINQNYVSNDILRQFQFNYRFYLNNKAQIILQVPIIANERITENFTEKINELGDIQSTLVYSVFNSLNQYEKLFRQNVLLVGGIRLPTGKYQIRNTVKQLHPIALQPGTGAFSFTGGLIYTATFKRFFTYSDINYRYHLENELKYQIGNSLIGQNMIGYKIFPKKDLICLSGVAYELKNFDRSYNLIDPYTKTQNINWIFGFQYLASQFEFNLFYFIPGYQVTVISQPILRDRISVGFSVFI